MKRIAKDDSFYRLTIDVDCVIMVHSFLRFESARRPRPMTATPLKHYLLASDFDQTLSFKDSGLVLSELLGISGFEERVAGLARCNLVQQGGELAYLIRHDPEFRGVRREHLVEVGRRIRLKGAIPALVDFMKRGIEGYLFSFFVISAAPREIVISALDGVLAPEHIYGTELEFDDRSGEVRASNGFRPATEKLR
jgi:hypothetical protein